MKQLKGFICGIIFAVALMAIPAVADSVEKTITVLTDYVTVTIDGEKKDVRNFVHEGTTYIALRDVSELLGCQVGWDDATRTASITTDKAPAEPSAPAQTAITVNDKTTITDAQVKTMYQDLDAYYGTKMTTDEKIQMTKDELVTQAVVDQKIDELGIANREDLKKEAEAQLAMLDMQYGSKDVTDQLLAYSGFASRAAYIDFAIRQAANSALLEHMSKTYPEYQAVKDGAQAYYDTNKENYKEQSVQVKHILIPTTDANNQPLEGDALVAAEATANQIASQMNLDNFDMILTQYNNDPGLTADGYKVTADSQFVQEFEDAALAFTEVGQVSPVVKTTYGYHILICIGINEYVPYNEFLNTYLNEQYGDIDMKYINQWVAEANVVYNDQVINAAIAQ